MGSEGNARPATASDQPHKGQSPKEADVFLILAQHLVAVIQAAHTQHSSLLRTEAQQEASASRSAKPGSRQGRAKRERKHRPLTQQGRENPRAGQAAQSNGTGRLLVLWKDAQCANTPEILTDPRVGANKAEVQLRAFQLQQL